MRKSYRQTVTCIVDALCAGEVKTRTIAFPLTMQRKSIKRVELGGVIAAELRANYAHILQDVHTLCVELMDRSGNRSGRMVWSTLRS